ncbi:uracil-DNA glycosylase [Zhongshania sp.]|uniref:uracil-DNA glycosylase n=1 Tax=Zhongshania sp. TaxID=1971902 RepID=UPI003568CEE0
MIEESIHPSWQPLLAREFNQEYYKELAAFLAARQADGVTIFPPQAAWFSAFAHSSLQSVKVVILGQDPYHAAGQAHGLCFSVLPSVKVPPSLRNIYKELQRDLGLPIPSHGYLLDWAEQGVLLLNAVLTVEEGSAGAHQGRGWEHFSDAVIETLNAEREGLVFMLWGAQAQKKGANIDAKRHLVLHASHPSPLSAHRGFLGCGHFSQANSYLAKRGQPEINWQLPALDEPEFKLIP